MPKIEINERDTTSFGSFVESYDVAYVPGLVGANGKLGYRQPRLFTSISEFKSWCGDSPVTFSNDQLYSSLITTTKNGFSKNAIPFDGVMFKDGASDPGYLYAIELLNSGLSVLYERINPEEIELEEKPTTGSYTGMDPDSFKPFTGGIAPDTVFKSIFGARSKMDDSSTTDIDEATSVSITYVTGTDEGSTTGMFSWIDSEGSEITVSELYLINSLDRRVPYTDLDSLAEALPELDDISIQTTSAKSSSVKSIQLTYSEQTMDLIKYWMTDKVFSVTRTTVNGAETVVAGAAQNTMPADWYTNFSDYGYKGGEAVVATEANKDSLVAPFKTSDTDIICNIRTIYDELAKVYVGDNTYKTGLLDKGNFSIKYLTSGGYPTYEYNGNTIVSAMMNLAATRGDCVALIDHTDNQYRETDITFDESLYCTVKNDETFSNGDLCCYATMFTPTAEYNITTQGTTARMPASFAYLQALANSIKSNAPWLAIAGAARGGVPNLAQDGMTTVIPNGVADMMQPRNGIAVNAITNIKPYGQTIWGNRTLRKEQNLVATSLLNVRNLVSDVKKVCYQTARSLTFEQDNDVLWVNFKGMIAPTLDRMVSGYGLTGYKIVKDEEHPALDDKGVVCAKIYLYPVYPVEDFYISIILSDDDVVVE